MRVLVPILFACTTVASFAQETELAKARLLEKEGDSIGARAILQRTASASLDAQAAYAEFLDRHRDPSARSEPETR